MDIDIILLFEFDRKFVYKEVLTASTFNPLIYSRLQILML